MRGPEHYVAAEQLIAEVQAVPGFDTEETREMLAQAQVHATLALAAAVAGERRGDEDQPWWDDTPTWSSLLAYPKQPDS